MVNKFLFILAVVVFPFYSVSADDNDTVQATYWQQEVNNKIAVTLNDVSHELDGYISIEYINNSPDSLNFIYFHLWPNAYKDNNTAFARQQLEHKKTEFYFSGSNEKGYIDELDFEVNNKPVKWEYDEKNIDICKLYLNEPLKSNDTLLITTSFHVKIPSSFSRLGHVYQSYQITQWYPKPAVYDKDGWHPMPYLDQGEFYSEFGSFDVKITLPKNYVLGATGDLQNEKEIKWLSEKAVETDNFLKILSEKEQLMSNKELRKAILDIDTFPRSSEETKTLRYTQKNIHDFAWFADKRYHVQKGKVELPHSKREVTTWAMFTNLDADLWRESIKYINNATYYYSLWIGDYPYNNVTAVEGALSAGAGMEYPNVTIVGYSGSARSLEEVIVHEVGHNWFYGVLGSNERDHAWMDEGINSFYEKRYFDHKDQTDTLQIEKQELFKRLKTKKAYSGLKGIDENDILYLLQVSRSMDQPAGLKASELTQLNYYTMVYGVPVILFESMETLLGKEEFDNAMQVYFEKWKFKHPQPGDIQNVLQEETGKYLEWIFDGFIKYNRKIDYEIKHISKNEYKDFVVIGQDYSYKKIKIVNKGKIKAPFSISAMKDGHVINTIWYGGFIGKMEVLFPVFSIPYIDYDAFQVNADNLMPDINPNNNRMRSKGIFKKIEKIRLQPLLSLRNPQRTEINYFPILGWNNYDKTMAGIAVYNGLLFPRKFEYLFIPMYGFGSQQFAGKGKLSYNKYPEKGMFHNYSVSVSGAMFSYNNSPFNQRFQRLSPSLEFNFKQKSFRSSVSQSIKLRSIFVNKEINIWNTLIDNYNKQDTSYIVNEIAYSYANTRAINPFRFNITLQQGDGFMKNYLEANYKITYQKKNKGLDIRFFGGGFFFHNRNNFYRDVRFRLSGISGSQDYLLDNIYLGRSEFNGIFSQQMLIKDGGFKINSPIGQTNKWLVAVNIKSSLPWGLPIKLYADAGTYEGAADAFSGSKPFVYDFGIALVLIPDIFEIYFPIALSGDLKQVIDLNTNNYFERISFVLNLNKLDPFEFIKKFNL